MKNRTLAIVLLLILFGTAEGNAQSLLNRLKDKAVEKVKDKVEQKVEDGIDRATDKVLDEGEELLTPKRKKTSKQTAEESDETETSEEVTSSTTPKPDKPQVASSSDFKRGSVIIFQDDVTAEQVGEFPSKWDLLSGTAETKTIGGTKAIEITDDGFITPLIEEPGAYLPEEFTLEYEFYYWDQRDDVGANQLTLVLSSNTNRTEVPDWYNEGAFSLLHVVCDGSEQSYVYNNAQIGQFEHTFTQGWHKVAVSFNKRALKVYFDGKRVVNLPRVNQPAWFGFHASFDYHDLTFIRNIVLAKGAVALYDRNAQSMTAVEKAIAETGKFVTNNILFDTGKATLKPESMNEIQKVADYMKKNPTARFEVQGHTDNQGSDKINDPLSQQRAEAIVKALENLGCDPFNLRAVGKGSHVPVADNSTAAGRAQNRRVEFVKK